MCRFGPLPRLLVAIAAPGPVVLASGPGEPAVGAAFASRALAVCQHAFELKEAEGPFPFPDFNPTKPDPVILPQVVPALRETDVTFRTWLSEMKALGDPPSGRTAWTDLLAAIESHVAINADQIAAAERGDGATFAADYDRGVATQAALLRAAEAAGVPDCAKVDR